MNVREDKFVVFFVLLDFQLGVLDDGFGLIQHFIEEAFGRASFIFNESYRVVLIFQGIKKITEFAVNGMNAPEYKGNTGKNAQDRKSCQ